MSAPSIAENWSERLALLAPGWDGYDATTITQEAIQAVARVYVVPCSNGGIQIETHQSGIDLEICIEPDGSISSVFISPAQVKP